MSLRELAWMATERKRVMGELTAWHLAGIVARMPFAAEALNVQEINPYRVEQPKSAEMLRLEEWQAKRGWRIFCGGGGGGK